MRTKQPKLNIWQRIGLYFYDKKLITLTIWIVLIAFGAVSYSTFMRREGFPSVEVPLGIVQVVAFENSAEKVDENFVRPLIEQAQKDTQLKDVTSSATDQGAVVRLTYQRGTNVQSSLDSLRDAVGTTLPQSGQVAYIKVNASKLTAQGDDILISVHGELTADELDKAAEKLLSLLNEKVTLAREVTIYPLIERVTNPVNNEISSTQVRFDRFMNEGTLQPLPSVAIGIAGMEDVDQLELYDQVTAVLSTDQAKSIGAGASVAVDFAEGIREQVSGLQQNLFEGLVVVLVVSFILISLRASLVTALSMTTTLAITIGILQLIGYSLNTITLFSLVLCLALIVDDTTIMVEAIDLGLQKKRAFREIVSESLRKVVRASATGTFTTILAFAPMLFIGGILGEFIRAIPVTIIISLVVSLIVSFLFIPLFMRISYWRGNHTSRIGIVGKLERGLGNALARCLIWSTTTKTRSLSLKLHAVFIAFLFVFIGGVLSRTIEFNIFPSPKDGLSVNLHVEAKNKESASILATELVADTVLKDVKELSGESVERITLLSQRGFASRNGFDADIHLTPLDARTATSVEIARELQDTLQGYYPDYIVRAEASGVGPPAGTFNVEILTRSSVESASLLARDIQITLENAVLERTDGTTARLIDVQVTPSVVVNRSGNERVLTVSAGFDAKDVSTLVTLAQREIESTYSSQTLATYGLPENSIQFDFGQEEENQDSFDSMGKAALPLFVAMILMMSVLFRSVLQSLLILTALPFAFFGVMAGLSLTDNAISFFTMLGVFALIGISVNNAILLTDYANQERDNGVSTAEAMAHAIKTRLRPLLTTSITSVLALLPLALNDPFWEGIAYTLIFGLLSSTVLVLLVFPYFYLIEEGVRIRLKMMLRRVSTKFAR